MQLVVSGATGFVGRALLLALAGAGHQVTAWVRDAARAAAELGPDVAVVVDRAALGAAVAVADGVIHLAGAPILGPRWSLARRRELRDSRVGTAAALIEAVRARSRPLPVFLSASAVGYYGDRGDALLAEDATPGEGFAAELCQAWETAAEAARPFARRVVTTRIGIVLGRHGGALGPLARVTRLGLGGKLGGGRQWVPWIHLDDVVGGIVHALTSAVDGPVNLVAPEAVRQGELARALGRALRRPAFVPTPGFAVRLALGEAAELLLGGQRVTPTALLASGYRFAFPTLEGALDDLLRDDHGVAIRRLRPGEAPTSEYLAARRPTHVLTATTRLARPLAEVAPFFAAAENLQLLTPPTLRFAIKTPRPIAMAAGTTIDYRIKLSGVPMTWRTVIERWEPGVSFVDAQHRGPYRAWWHEHRFRAEGEGTVMEDAVYFAAPLGVLGRIAGVLFIHPMLRDIFAYRAQQVRLRFGGGVAAALAAAG
jgi:uncharacterized protein (TIGR01777 family)